MHQHGQPTPVTAPNPYQPSRIFKNLPVTDEINTAFTDFLIQEKLPPSFLEKLHAYYLPLSHTVHSWQSALGAPLILGINGAQGTGKSTLAAALSLALEKIHKLRTTVISIDDLYLPRSDRQALSREIHPLLATRGVPGTHDVALGSRILAELLAGNPCSIPRFDKSCDDRAPESQWTRIEHPVDVIIFEGWCIGAMPESPAALTSPINDLEATEDPHAIWRTFVNDSLAGPYARLFSSIHKLVMLCPPGFECIRDWRGEQEEKLRQRFLSRGEALPSGVMNDEQLGRFIMHYERLTRWMLREMPTRADVVFSMNSDRAIIDSTP